MEKTSKEKKEFDKRLQIETERLNNLGYYLDGTPIIEDN